MKNNIFKSLRKTAFCAIISVSISAYAAPPSFGAGTCNGSLYLAQTASVSSPTELTQVVTATSPYSYIPLGTAAFNYNAIGYRASDGYLYGIASIVPNRGHVVRVGSDGTAELLGLPAGLPANAFTNGAIGTDGFFYVRQGAQSEIWRIDLASLAATAITLSDATLAGATTDFAWVGGLLYSVNSVGQLISINPSTGFVNAIGAPTAPRNYGVVFGAPNGLFVNDNAGSGLYQVDLTTGVLTLQGSSPGTGSNDGANCVSANLIFNQGVTGVPTLNTIGLLVLSALLGFVAFARRKSN